MPFIRKISSGGEQTGCWNGWTLMPAISLLPPPAPDFTGHMRVGFSGNEDKNSVGRALEMFPLALAVNVADMEATYYLEGSVK